MRLIIENLASTVDLAEKLPALMSLKALKHEDLGIVANFKNLKELDVEVSNDDCLKNLTENVRICVALNLTFCIETFL